MILKEDSPPLLGTQREQQHTYPPAPSQSAAQHILADSDDESILDGDEEEIPSYFPHSTTLTAPPTARIGSADPSPWAYNRQPHQQHQFPPNDPPRYSLGGIRIGRRRKRLVRRRMRFIPVGLLVGSSGFVLASCINFIIESIINMTQTHIKPQLFVVFEQILTPTHILIAASSITIVAAPIHHLLPLPKIPPYMLLDPNASTSTLSTWRTLPLQTKLLKLIRIIIPSVILFLYTIAACWYLAIALDRSASGGQVTYASYSSLLSSPGTGQGPAPFIGNRTLADIATGRWVYQLGNGVIVEDEHGAGMEGSFWSLWFWSDRNVKAVLISCLCAFLSSILFLVHAFPSFIVYRFFSGTKDPLQQQPVKEKLIKWYEEKKVGLKASFGSNGQQHPDGRRTRRRFRLKKADETVSVPGGETVVISEVVVDGEATPPATP